MTSKPAVRLISWTRLAACTMAMGLVVAACTRGQGPEVTPTGTAGAEATPSVAASPTPTPGKPYTGGLVFGEQAQYGGTFVQAVPAGPAATWNTLESPVLNLTPFVAPMSASLLYMDPLSSRSPVIAPDIAATWELQQGGAVLLFKLKPGVLFLNGEPLTSADVVFTLDLIKDPKKYGLTAAPTGNLIRQYVTKVEAVDANSVRVTLSRPVNGVIFQLADRANSIRSKAGWTSGCQDIASLQCHRALSAGPFKLDGYTKGEGAHYVKNVNYFKPGLPLLDGMDIVVIPDEAARNSALRTGAAHRAKVQAGWATASSLAAQQPRLTVRESFSFQCGTAILVNPKIKPYDDLRVRKALTLSINREAWATSLGLIKPDSAPVTDYFAPPFDLAPEAKQQLLGYMPGDMPTRWAEAKKLLWGAGVQEGGTLKVQVLDAPLERDAGAFLAQQLSNAGVAAQIEALDQPAMDARMAKKDFTIRPVNTCVAPDPDIALYSQVHSTGPANYGWGKKEWDAQVDIQSKNMDPATRRDQVRQLVLPFLQTYYYIPVTFWSLPEGVWDFVHGYPAYSLNGYYERMEYVWIEKSKALPSAVPSLPNAAAQPKPDKP